MLQAERPRCSCKRRPSSAIKGKLEPRAAIGGAGHLGGGAEQVGEEDLMAGQSERVRLGGQPEKLRRVSQEVLRPIQR